MDKFYMAFSVGPVKGAPRSTFTVDQYGIQTVKRNVVPYKGKVIVVSEKDEFFGGEDSKGYRSKVMDSPTWGKLFSVAKASQKRTLDLHHAFFEGAYPSGAIETINGQTVVVLRLSLGS